MKAGFLLQSFFIENFRCKKHSHNLLFLFCTLLMLGLSLLLSPITRAENTEEKVKLTEQQLNKVTSEIQSLQKQLSKEKSSQKSEQTSLKKIEQDLAELYKQSKKLKQEQAEVKAKITSLKKEEQILDKKNQEQQTALKKDLQSIYKLGRQEKIKLLLNQENPQELARLLKYYDYYSEARLARIVEFQKTIEEISNKRLAIENELAALKEIDSKIEKEAKALEKKQQDRTAVLDEINNSITSKDQKLKVLKEDQSRLSKLLSSLKGIWADIPAKLAHASISKQKGKLPFPVKDGKILHSFGTQRAEGLLKWNGWFIQAPINENVTAIHDGRVVFSDWIRGYGMLIIVDHSDGYLSLYGHNASLYKEAGDWIQAGDVLGTVGNSGGQYDMGLYFELRKDGEPINPKNWLQR